MSNYRSQADASQKAKANRIISSAGGGKHSTPFGEGASTATKRKGYANGGFVEEEMIEGEMPSSRLDRPSRKKNGATEVNVIIAQKDPMPQPVPVPAPPPAAAGIGAPPGPPPGGPPMPPMMGRKRGGRVSMDAGAGGAEGRLDKIKAYGKKAKA